MTVPFQNLKTTHSGFIKDFLLDMQKLLQSDNPDFIGSNSPTVASFEKECAEYLGVKHAIGVGSGTDALLLALDALGVKPGDEVIMPAYGFIATADVVVRLGATPVFIDIDGASFNMNPELLAGAITDKTKVIIPVHLFGQSCEMDAIMKIANEHKLPVIEDVAQAMGAEWNGKKLGSIGAIGAFSFYPTKNLGGCGDGGLMTTNRDDLAQKIRLYRDHGRGQNGFETVGYNSRLDSIQARYLSYKMPDLNESLFERVDNARLYNKLLADFDLTRPEVPVGDENLTHSFNLYTIRVRDRDRLRRFLQEKQIGSAVYYDTVMPLTPALQFLGHKAGEFPESEKACKEVVSLPVWPGMTRKHVEAVAEAIETFLANNIAMTGRR